MFSLFEKFDDFFYFWESTMRMKWHKSSAIFDLIVHEKLSGHTSILTGDIVGFTEYSESSERDIFEITDGSGDDWEHLEVCK